MLKRNKLLIMKVYVQKNTPGVFEHEGLDEGFNIGKTYQDYLDGLWVKLTKKQNDFRLANPTASVREMLVMMLDPVIEYPEQPEQPQLPSLEDVLAQLEDVRRELNEVKNEFDGVKSDVAEISRAFRNVDTVLESDTPVVGKGVKG